MNRISESAGGPRLGSSRAQLTCGHPAHALAAARLSQGSQCHWLPAPVCEVCTLAGPWLTCHVVAGDQVTWPLTTSRYTACRTRCPGQAGPQSGFILGQHHLLTKGPRSWSSGSCSCLAGIAGCQAFATRIGKMHTHTKRQKIKKLLCPDNGLS